MGSEGPRASAARPYLRPGQGAQESPAAGSAWAPPCPAVQRLRDCVFRPYALLAEGEDGKPGRWVLAF